MTWAMHAIGYMMLGKKEEASLYFNESFASNTRLPFYVWSEQAVGGVKNFITGAGGFLQAAIFGLFGIRIWKDCMAIDPFLVDGMMSICARSIHYRTSVFTICANLTTTNISVLSGP